jgi:hypothetical protein
MLYLVHLDAFHLDDLLFTQALGRLMTGTPHRLVLVHGDAGLSERLMEARGLFPSPGAPPTPAERAVREQAVRQAQRQIVGRLTDAQVPAVGVHGGDRGLVRIDESGLAPGQTSWLAALAQQRAVPVVSTLVGGEVGVAPDADVLVALARGLAEGGARVEAVVFPRDDRQPPFADLDGSPKPTADPSEMQQAQSKMADAPVAAALADAGIALRVTTPPLFFGPSGPGGTCVGREGNGKVPFAG